MIVYRLPYWPADLDEVADQHWAAVDHLNHLYREWELFQRLRKRIKVLHPESGAIELGLDELANSPQYQDSIESGMAGSVTLWFAQTSDELLWTKPLAR